MEVIVKSKTSAICYDLWGVSSITYNSETHVATIVHTGGTSTFNLETHWIITMGI